MSNGKDAFSAPTAQKTTACVSQGIKIKGEVSGSEDLFVDGQIEGKVTLDNSIVTIGPNANLKAEVAAKEIVVRGRVQGKLQGASKIQVWNTARIEGDLKADRIAIEEGAELHGRVDAGTAPAGAFEVSKKQDSTKSSNAAQSGAKEQTGTAAAGAD